jgi:hypothetical protein
MAKDDYFVVAYKILKYLYNCLKRDEKVNFDILRAEVFGIPEKYWNFILVTLSKEGYISVVCSRSIFFTPFLNRSVNYLKKFPRHLADPI